MPASPDIKTARLPHGLITHKARSEGGWTTTVTREHGPNIVISSTSVPRDENAPFPQAGYIYEVTVGDKVVGNPTRRRGFVAHATPFLEAPLIHTAQPSPNLP